MGMDVRGAQLVVGIRDVTKDMRWRHKCTNKSEVLQFIKGFGRNVLDDLQSKKVRIGEVARGYQFPLACALLAAK
jgi:hypothetical protein